MLLATIAAQSLNHQALATPPVDIVDPPHTKQVADQKQETDERVTGTIASPESLVAQEFSPELLRASKPLLEKPMAPPAQQAQKAVVPTVVIPSLQATSASIAPPETDTTPTRMSAQKDKDGSMPMNQSTAPQVASAKSLAEVQSLNARDLQEVPPPNPSRFVTTPNTFIAQEPVSPQQTTTTVTVKGEPIKPCLEIEDLQSQLRELENIKDKAEFRASPALSINIPVGFGADNNTGFISGTFQQRTRYTDQSDGALGIGIGLGDARKAVGVELSYTFASFGGSRDFGSGGFNVKVHRQVADDLAIAAGWNGFLNLGSDNDFENSIYGTVTKIFRTQDDINKPFSRVAVTAGVGSGQFRSEDNFIRDSGGVNVFGNVAVRVVQPVSLIAEWSGQDLGVGLSIAPFKNIPLVITPAVRDIVGAGDGPRFVLGAGVAFKL